MFKSQHIDYREDFSGLKHPPESRIVAARPDVVDGDWFVQQTAQGGGIPQYLAALQTHTGGQCHHNKIMHMHVRICSHQRSLFSKLILHITRSNKLRCSTFGSTAKTCTSISSAHGLTVIAKYFNQIFFKV